MVNPNNDRGRRGTGASGITDDDCGLMRMPCVSRLDAINPARDCWKRAVSITTVPTNPTVARGRSPKCDAGSARRLTDCISSGHSSTAPNGAGHVLVLNSGSSSLKSALVEPANGDRVMVWMGERLGSADAVLQVTGPCACALEERLPGGDHQTVVARGLALVGELERDGVQLIAAGHRVVHGGERFAASVLVDDARVAAFPGSEPW